LYNHGNNPGFTVLTYNRSTLRALVEHTYSLEVKTHAGGRNPDVPWSIRYSQNEGYGVSALTPSALEPAWRDMAAFSSPSAGHFNEEYSGGRRRSP
jgi:hypothetical protein